MTSVTETPRRPRPATLESLWQLTAIVARMQLTPLRILGVAALGLVAVLLGDTFTEPPIRAVATLPGRAGVGAAFAAELIISALLMLLVLATGRSTRLSPYTGVFVGGLLVDTQDARRLAHELPRLARAEGARLYEIRPLDSDLEGVFRYLVER